MKPMKQMDPDRLRNHIVSTYLSLRFGMGLITFAFPVLVYVAGRYQGYDLQCSLSAYYWAGADGWFNARTVFVGSLFAIGAFFYLYKGFTQAENIAFNLAAVFALLVALFPTSQPVCVDAPADKLTLHGISAVLLFVCLAYVVLFRARDTLPLVPPGRGRNNHAKVAGYERAYASAGALMLASPLTAYILNSFSGNGGSHFIFFIEAAGVWSFGLFWWLKSGELKSSSAVEHGLDRHIEVQPTGRLTAQARFSVAPDRPGDTQAINEAVVAAASDDEGRI